MASRIFSFERPDRPRNRPAPAPTFKIGEAQDSRHRPRDEPLQARWRYRARRSSAAWRHRRLLLVDHHVAGGRRQLTRSARRAPRVILIWQPRREVWVRPKARSSMSSSSSLASSSRSYQSGSTIDVAGRAGERALAGALDVDMCCGGRSRAPKGPAAHRPPCACRPSR